MSTTELALPTSVVPSTWNPDTAALMEFSGLSWIQGGQRVFAPSGVMAAFLNACARTGLDPSAKQIYAMEIGGKWSIVTGVDGMRVVAQRTGQYLGQTPIQWTADGVNWVDVWLSDDAPAAARVGVRRVGFAEPLYQVVTWKEFGKTTGQWRTMKAHMLGIRAETHALRRAFPNDLSGLYTPEDIDGGHAAQDALVIAPTEDWEALIDAAQSKDELKAIVDRCQEAEELSDRIRTKVLTKYGMFNRAAEDAEREQVTA
ncbi:recombinase RecT [Herbiconiux sp. KACC 21604]|uniref:recombinase RecT n=1 Tax=unclassified Herbiconiux TaxID=2618217 RepID=UPI001492D727|nr:recombinase RecT [Herbiconiux sp. SALV-R1]QJU52955.1 hypothetical protein HL652_04435 [Herbiconiux sp. SALV-R1]WPO87879.1 recombinase RecT [Herbiconiux sp. KACC 21604]